MLKVIRKNRITKNRTEILSKFLICFWIIYTLATFFLEQETEKMAIERLTISLQPEVFQALESLRGSKTHFRSGYINEILRKEFGLTGKAKR